MSVDMTLANKADTFFRKGITGKELGRKLGVTTPHANNLASIGALERKQQGLRLTVPEIMLLTSLVREHRRLVAAGETRSPKSADVSWAANSRRGWAAATAQKRIFDTRYDEKLQRQVSGMGFVHVSHNGYIWLTDAGWILVHTMGLMS